MLLKKFFLLIPITFALWEIRFTFVPVMIENTLNLSSDNVKDMQAESPAKESKETVADRIPKLPKNVHWAVKAIVEPFPEDRKEAMSLMALPFLGMLGGNARFLYRNQEVHHLGFECCLVGEQSIGKSALTRMQNVLISKVIEEDNETRRKSDEYADECIAAGDGKDKPKDPHYGTRIMMPSTTKAQFYQNIKNLNGKRAIIVCPEIDSLHVPNNWSRDGGANERLMFDTEVGGQDTKSHAGTSARVPVAVNLVTSGTPKAVKNHYRNAEDGLVTRVGFCSFPQDMNEEAEERPRSKKNLETLLSIQEILLSEKEGDVINIPQLKKQQLEWCARQKTVSDASGNQSISTFRKRAAVMGFRAGCVLYLLDGRKLTRKALEFAIWVSEYVLYFQLKYFGEQMNESIEENAMMMQVPVFARNANAWVFCKLPGMFCYGNVEEAYTQIGMKATGYRMVVSRWIRNGWVEKVDKEHFRKTATGIQICNKMGREAS